MSGHAKRRSKNGPWRARYPLPPDEEGRPQQRERVFRTKAEADAWLDEQRHGARTGTYIDPNAGRCTVAAVAAEWRGTWLDLEPKTRAGYEAILRKHILPTFGGRRVSSLTPAAVQDYVNELAARLAPNTVRRIYGVLAGVCQTAVARRYIAVSPCAAVKLPKKGARREYVIPTEREVHALAAAIHPHYRVLIYTAAITGMRAGELRALRRGRVDLLRGTVRVAEALKEVHSSSAEIAAADKGLIFGPTKTHAERTIRLPRFLLDMLAADLRGPLPGGTGADALIFTTPGGAPIRQSLFYRRVFKPAVRQALPPEKHGLRFHDLRHAAATIAIHHGAHPKQVQAMLGHEDIRTTLNVYGHHFPSAEDALADALDAAFSAPATVTSLRAAS